VGDRRQPRVKVENFGVLASAVASPTTHDLAAVWASGPCDVWAIGDAVYHGIGQP
jgi:hypothetical protein